MDVKSQMAHAQAKVDNMNANMAAMTAAAPMQGPGAMAAAAPMPASCAGAAHRDGAETAVSPDPILERIVLIGRP